MSDRDRLQKALTTALRRLEAVDEEASPLAAAAALEATSSAARLLSRYDVGAAQREWRDQLLQILQRAASLMRSLSRAELRAAS